LTALDFLLSLERLGMKFGLENMQRLCAALDHPERSFRSVIVAGTNGKGSVAAMVSAGLRAAGVRGGRYTSPHLERLEERFVLDEREVDSGELEAAAATLREAIELLVRNGTLEGPPTFFESCTAIAFELFRRGSIETAVVEVGLGGRLDATNVITPMAAAITSIDFDHEELLGTTLAAIAREKAGVIKPGIPVVVGSLPDEADAVIRGVCRERAARYVRAPEHLRGARDTGGGRFAVTLAVGDAVLEDVALALPGRHQVDNAATAASLMHAMGLPLHAIRAGLTDAQWPGRLETLHWHGADVLLDAAHNPAGARALGAHLRASGWTTAALVMGAMREKNVTAMLSALLPFAGSLICTTPPNPRALAADALSAAAAALPGAPASIRAIDDPREALSEACRTSDRVVVTGSIFLIGALRGILR
jgi:dihydrofolate synthase/folylpolyglutamate synthase